MISSRTAEATDSGSPSAIALAAVGRSAVGSVALAPSMSVSSLGNELPQACFIEDVARGESGFAFAEALHRHRI